MSTHVDAAGATSPLTKKDFVTDQEVRWCPGCGDYAILNAVQQVFPELGIPREKFVIVSGIGCSSRFPYYMNTYGFHSIHGRAPAIATGIKVARPDLSVWVATGDGDALAIGGNHVIHMLRRNVGLKVLMFNNRIYGLTKGQFSPTSVHGQRTKSSPFGVVDRPFNPLALALGAGATFVARALDVDTPHLKMVLKRAAAHKGSAFVEVFQNCNIFNDGAFDEVREKDRRAEKALYLEHGKPLLFGKERKRGLKLRDFRFEIVTVGEDGVTEADVTMHDEGAEAARAFLLAELADHPEMPIPLGIFRVSDEPPFEDLVHQQKRSITERLGPGDLGKLIRSGDTWVVK